MSPYYKFSLVGNNNYNIMVYLNEQIGVGEKWIKKRTLQKSKSMR